MLFNSSTYKYCLWGLKLGAILNVYFLLKTQQSQLANVDPYLLIPAQILFIVSAYRCLFPNNYSKNIVLHDTILSSIFFTRLLATFVEILYIYMFSYVLRLINADQYPLLDLLSWLMVVQVTISQCFVWGAILLRRERYYYFEELGWFIIFVLNTAISIVLLFYSSGYQEYKTLIHINLIFGILYLPWQIIHLKSISSRIEKYRSMNIVDEIFSINLVLTNLKKSIFERVKTTEPELWGGLVGLSWMVSYWIILIPIWFYYILLTFSLN
jgi:hypothetical protein